jgi:hypothetical protein
LCRAVGDDRRSGQQRWFELLLVLTVRPHRGDERTR